jgi:hypothetical protein
LNYEVAKREFATGNFFKRCGSMPSVVDKKFHEWTKSLDTHDSMVSIFEHIRDIPYSLSVPIADTITSPEELLVAGKGSCGPKHYLLAEMFRKMNMSVVYATIAFSWNDPDLRYPPGLRKLAGKLPVAYHIACRVQVGCRWILVDATWDPPLAKAGFPVNDHWDGYSEMRCAAKPLKYQVRTAFNNPQKIESCYLKRDEEFCAPDSEKNHWNEVDRARYYHEKVNVRTPGEMELIKQFNREFDAWLDNVRLDKFYHAPEDFSE